MEVYRDQQKKARNAWVTIGASAPASKADADAAFSTAFTADGRVTAQFTSCPGYNASTNKLSQVAGVRSDGTTAFDPCMCSAFCTDIVQSTIDHERTHVPTIIAGFLSGLPAQAGCKAVAAAQPLCDRLNANTLVNSEIISYTVGITTVDNAISRIANAPDPSSPSMQCTWTPLAPVTMLRSAPDGPVPASIWQRLALLAERFWNGITA